MIKNYKSILALTGLLVSCCLLHGMNTNTVNPPGWIKVAIVIKNPHSLPSNICFDDKESLKEYSKVPLKKQLELRDKITAIIGSSQYNRSFSEFDGTRVNGTSGDDSQGYLMALITNEQRCKLLKIKEIAEVDYFFYLNHKILKKYRLEGNTTLNGIFLDSIFDKDNE